MQKETILDINQLPTSGIHVIEASAGTGKTYTICNIYLKLILTRNLHPSEILVVTFTHMATEELKVRIRNRLNEVLLLLQNNNWIDDQFLSSNVSLENINESIKTLRFALSELDTSAVYTIHGFCQKVLADDPFHSRALFESEILQDENTLINEIISDYWRKYIINADPLLLKFLEEKKISFNHFKNIVSKIKNINEVTPALSIIPEQLNTLFSADKFKDYVNDADELYVLIIYHFIYYYFKELPARKSLKQQRTFDDLLNILHSSLTDNSELIQLIRNQYKTVLIDEFQDTDIIQYEIFQKFFFDEKSLVFFIGDPKQSIYSFRGADIYAYIKARNSADNIFTLNTNWRSSPELIDSVNYLYSNSEYPFINKEIKFTNVKSAENKSQLVIKDSLKSLNFIYLNDDQQTISKSAAEDIVIDLACQNILSLINLSYSDKAYFYDSINNSIQRLQLSDIAILVDTNDQADSFKNRLAQSGISSAIYKGKNVFETPVATNLFLILQAIINNNSNYIFTALSTPLINYSADEIYKIKNDSSLYDQVFQIFFSLLNTWQISGFMSSFRLLLNKFNIKQKILSSSLGERQLTDLLHIAELLQKESISEHYTANDLLQWFAMQINEIDKSEEKQLRLETDEGSLKILTIHSAKGLEFPIVFLPFAWSPIKKSDPPYSYHNIKTDLKNIHLLENKNISALADIESLAEDSRLLYVALTRAKFRCYVYTGNITYSRKKINPSNSALFTLLEADNYTELSNKLSANSNITLQYANENKTQNLSTRKTSKDDIANLSYKINKRVIQQSWSISSYSSILHNMEINKIDEPSNFTDEKVEADLPSTGFFAFPAGPDAGSCIHEIFEKIDFTRPISEQKQVITSVLFKYGYASQQNSYVDCIESMLINVISKTLIKHNNLSLSKIDIADRLIEWKFYLSINKIHGDQFKSLFKKHFNLSVDSEFYNLISKKEIHINNGYLTGFIDLIFRYENKYYIIDWKSNHLGNSYSDYNESQISEAMNEHSYNLQYLLYTIALNRYLENNLQDYSYEDNFGGVLYLFVRGIDTYSNNNGIFYVKPEINFINEFSSLIISGGNIE